MTLVSTGDFRQSAYVRFLFRTSFRLGFTLAPRRIGRRVRSYLGRRWSLTVTSCGEPPAPPRGGFQPCAVPPSGHLSTEQQRARRHSSSKWDRPERISRSMGWVSAEARYRGRAEPAQSDASGATDLVHGHVRSERSRQGRIADAHARLVSSAGARASTKVRRADLTVRVSRVRCVAGERGSTRPAPVVACSARRPVEGGSGRP